MKDRILFYAFMASLVVHVLIIGAGGGFLPFTLVEKNPQITLIEIEEKQQPTILPEIKVLGVVQKLGFAPTPESSVVEQKEEDLNQPEDGIKLIEKDAVSQEQAAEAMLRYQDMIKQKIESCRSYPAWAQRRKIKGTVGIKFTILASGLAENIKIIQNSGSPFLDSQGIKTIQKASPFIPIPEQIQHDLVTIKIAIMYSLI